jgi:methionyl-tRNA formyltransferase
MPIKNKIIFFGTPKIAAVCLEAILNRNDVQILAVVCQPDKPIGRKHQIIFSPVKALAIQKNIPILQEAKIGILYDKIKDLNPDLIFTCAFGQFIPDNILSIPKYHCINLHASILPKLRGGAPIH